MADVQDNSPSMVEDLSRKSTDTDYLYNRSMIKPRRSLTTVRTDITSQSQAEDLSTTGRFGVQRTQRWQTTRARDQASTVIVENERSGSCLIGEELSERGRSMYRNVANCRGNDDDYYSATQHPGRLCDRPSSDPSELLCGKNLHSVDDINGCLSARVVEPVDQAIIAETVPSNEWNSSAQLTQPSQRRGFHSEDLLCEEGSMFAAVNSLSLDVQNFGSETVSLSRDGRSTSAASLNGVTSSASYGALSHITTNADPLINSGRNTSTVSHRALSHVTMNPEPVLTFGPSSLPQNGSSQVTGFPAGCSSLHSLSGTSGMFERTPNVPAGLRPDRLADLWPTARGMGEPSPIATVIPQVQTAVNTLHQRPPQRPSSPTEPAGSAGNIASPTSPPTRKRKRKRRCVFGSRRRRKKSSQTTAVNSGRHNPLSDGTMAEQAATVSGRPDPAANCPSTDTLNAAAQTRSQVAVINNISAAITCPTEQSDSNSVVRSLPANTRTALKPIENHLQQQQQQSGHLMRTSNIAKSSVPRRSIKLGSWLDTKSSGSGRKARTVPYIGRKQSSTDVQKVPSTSPPHDIFEFCGDDDEVVPSAGHHWLTARSYVRWSAVHNGRQKHGHLTNCANKATLR